jgi:hypothetical protein
MMLESETPSSAATGDVDDVLSPRVEMSPAEALALLEAGKTIQNARIKRLRLHHFTGATAVSLHNVHIGKLEISRSTFAKDVQLTRCQLGRTIIAHSTFEGGLKLRSSELRHFVFQDSKVTGKLELTNAQARDRFELLRCTFSGCVGMWEARFCGWLEVKNCTFEDVADLRSFHADQGASLVHCEFRKEALFRGSSVAKKFDLGQSTFHKMLDLSKVKLQDFAYLEDIRLEQGACVALKNAVAERILIRPEQIHGRLQSECQGDYESAVQEYGLLKACYQKLHRYAEEDWAFYHFKVCQRRRRPIDGKPWRAAQRFLDWLFLDRGCGYGTKPLRAVGAALVIIMVFTAIYAVGINHFDVERPPINDWPIEHWSNRVLFALTTAVAVFTSGFGGDQITQAHGWILVPLMAEALLGTFLWGLFIVAFSRKVIR